MTDDNPNDRPPAFPPELLNRPAPAGMRRAAEMRDANAALRETQLAHLELLHGLQRHIEEAIGLLDAGESASARAALDRAVIVLDSALAPKVG